MAEEKVDAAQPFFDVLGCVGIDGGGGIYLAGADVQQGPAGLQVPDASAHCRHALVGVRPGRKDNVVKGVRKIIKEGDFSGDPADIPTADLRKDDQSVVCPRVVTDDQQGTLGRHVLSVARRDAAAPVGERPFAALGEAEANPMACPRCQGEMHIIAFLTDYAVVDRIIAHLKLTFVAERPPPPQVVSQEFLMDSEASADYS